MRGQDARDDRLDLGRIPVRRLLRHDLDVRVERGLLALLPALRQRVAREAAEEGDVPGLDLPVHDVRIGLAERAGVLPHHREVVRAGAGHEAPGVGGDGDPGIGRLLHDRQHRVAEVGVRDDQAHLLGDRRFEVGDSLVQVGVGTAVDDLADLRIRQGLEDELHLRHLTEDVLAELLDVGDGQLATGARLAAVRLPAPERQGLVHLPVGPAEACERDLARRLVLRKQRRLEERVLEGGRLGGVHLAEALPGRDDDRLRGRRLLAVGAPAARRREDERGAEHYECQHPHPEGASAGRSRLLPTLHHASFSREPQLVSPFISGRVPGAVSIVRRRRPRSNATRSPETSIPTMIAAPNTMNCNAVERPRMSSICVRNVSARAATHVEVALASPPDNAAPAMTTAAMGARRYDAPNAGSMLMRRPPSSTAAPPYSAPAAVYANATCVRTRSPAIHAARGFAPTAWKRRPAAV